MINNSEPIHVALSDLKPSKLNPRTHFDDAGIGQLRDSLEKHGQLTPLIVRPRWAVGATTRKQLDAISATDKITGFEIVSGECRFRAASLSREGATLNRLSAIVKELCDPEVVEINLTEQLQRNELTAVEEGTSFKRMLAYKNDDGTPRHTVVSLAQTVSKTEAFVYQRIKLIDLPEVTTKALNSGKLGATIAARIASIPDEAAKVVATKAILAGNDGEAMTERAALEYISDNHMKQLKGAPFDQEDASLVKHLPQFSPHSPCSTCQFRTGFNKKDFGHVKRGDICTRPACWQAKADTTFARISEAATKEGKRVLSSAESAKIFPEWARGGEMTHDSIYIIVDTKPEEHLLKAVVKKVPTWRELIAVAAKKEMKVEIVVAKDQNGMIRELANRDLLIAAAVKAGEPIFREKSARKPGHDDAFSKRQKEEKAASAKQLAVAIAALDALFCALTMKTNVPALWVALQPAAIDHAGHDGLWLVLKWRKIKPADSGTAESPHAAAVRKLLQELPGSESTALTICLLIAGSLRWSGIKSKQFLALADMAALDVPAIEKKAVAELKAPKIPKAKVTPLPAAAGPGLVRGSSAKTSARKPKTEAKPNDSKKPKRVRPFYVAAKGSKKSRWPQ